MSNADVPTGDAATALSAIEQTFAGTWTVDQPPTDSPDYEYRGTLRLERDRQFALFLHVMSTKTGAYNPIDRRGGPWRADDKGDLYVETNKGPFHLRLTRKGSSLEICYGAFGCFIGHQ